MEVLGYSVRRYVMPIKRYCQMLDLHDDPKLIAEYRRLHSEKESWNEILDGIRSVGILEMEIYNKDNRLFMIVETVQDFDWYSAMKKLATLPRQAEWEEKVSFYQKCRQGASSEEKWQLMERIFRLYIKKI